MMFCFMHALCFYSAGQAGPNSGYKVSFNDWATPEKNNLQIPSCSAPIGCHYLSP